MARGAAENAEFMMSVWNTKRITRTASDRERGDALRVSASPREQSDRWAIAALAGTTKVHMQLFEFGMHESAELKIGTR